MSGKTVGLGALWVRRVWGFYKAEYLQNSFGKFNPKAVTTVLAVEAGKRFDSVDSVL